MEQASETAATRRGTIIRIPSTEPGLVVVDGQQKAFALDGVWLSAVAPALNQVVDVVLDEAGQVKGLTVVDTKALTVEQLKRFGRAAQAGAGELATKLHSMPPDSKQQLQKGSIAAAALLGLALVGWLILGGSGPSKRELANLINERLGEDAVCWSLATEKELTFPVTVEATFGSPLEKNPILSGLLKGEYITLTKGRQQYREFYQLELTEKGKKAEVWDAKERGFCLGKRSVDEVLRWTEPGSNGQGQTVTEVTYTWHLDHLPRWADKELFAGIPGVTKPKEESVTAQKTSDGWQIVTAADVLKKVFGGL